MTSLKYSEASAGAAVCWSILTSLQLGAIRFDRDLRAVMAYLSSQTVFGDIREKFIRLQQIATILNLDSVRQFLSLFFVLHTDAH